MPNECQLCGSFDTKLKLIDHKHKPSSGVAPYYCRSHYEITLYENAKYFMKKFSFSVNARLNDIAITSHLAPRVVINALQKLLSNAPEMHHFSECYEHDVATYWGWPEFIEEEPNGKE